METLGAISLSDPLDSLARSLGRSFAESGFAVVRDHGIPAELIVRADACARAFFALPEQAKRRYHIPGGGGARGYTPFGQERAKGAPARDLKEFWHIGRSLPAGDPLEAHMPSNIWPDDVAGFETTFEALFAAFETCGRRILSAIALHLGLDRAFFDPTIENGNSVLRLLHYPPVEVALEGEIRAAAHGDINAITLLLGAEESGLQLLDRKGQWIPVSPPPGALAVNIGDMLERLTAGRLPSTLHRVVNPAGEAARRARYSMPFFLHFRPDYLIEPLYEGGEEPISAHDFLMQRLREINLA